MKYRMDGQNGIIVIEIIISWILTFSLNTIIYKRKEIDFSWVVLSALCITMLYCLDTYFFTIYLFLAISHAHHLH